MDVREQLALWYLRLNGYFTMPNFIAHAHDGARTDVDVLAIRFPYSAEYPDDGEHLRFPPNKTDIVLSEVKTGECSLNGPWRKKNATQPLETVLKRIGVFAAPALVDAAANEIYARRKFPQDEEGDKWPFVVRIVCFGQSRNMNLQDVTQIMWPQVISFIGSRFQTYVGEKADHDHWDSFGKFLWKELSEGKQPNVAEIVKNWKNGCRCWP